MGGSLGGASSSSLELPTARWCRSEREASVAATPESENSARVTPGPPKKGKVKKKSRVNYYRRTFHF